MARTYCVTYDIVTPESAEYGDVAERGFCSGGSTSWPVPLPDGVVGEAFVEWRKGQDFDVAVDPTDCDGYEAPPIRGDSPVLWRYSYDGGPSYGMVRLDLISFSDTESWWLATPDSGGVPAYFKLGALQYMSVCPPAFWANRALTWRRLASKAEVEKQAVIIPERMCSESEACCQVMAKILRDAGASYHSPQHFQPGDWYQTEGEQDYTDGSTTSYAYHLDGWTPEEERRVCELVHSKG